MQARPRGLRRLAWLEMPIESLKGVLKRGGESVIEYDDCPSCRSTPRRKAKSYRRGGADASWKPLFASAAARKPNGNLSPAEKCEAQIISNGRASP